MNPLFLLSYSVRNLHGNETPRPHKHCVLSLAANRVCEIGNRESLSCNSE